jgi:drug/metabolite transporter (DMT)-like permease
MSLKNILHLIFLGALWGASYLFIRLSIDEFGPFLIAELRLMIAAILIGLFLFIHPARRTHLMIQCNEWRKLMVVGVFNSALPFCLIAFAMGNLTAGMGAILNSTAPIWGSIVAYVWLREQLSKWQMLGLLLGVLGVFVLVGDRATFHFSGQALNPIAILVATLSYGASASYIKKYCADVSALKMTFGSMLMGALLLLPLACYFWPEAPISLNAWLAVLGLGAFSTAYAYVLYFRLIEQIGPAKAISSTFLIPVFGIFFGELFLQEQVSLKMIVGACVILIGTALSIEFIRPDLLLKKIKNF